MKESELKKSEKKQVILSTYIMVSEGLDIPTLNAEFLITPKTDIVQTVGRVLRAKHSYSHPIIYDFVDSHDLFQRQWLKRKTYYKKQNYKIIGSNIANYNNDYSSRKVLYEPKFGEVLCSENTNKKTLSSKSNIPSEKSIAEDTYSDSENNLNEICLLKIKQVLTQMAP
jgi:superfamily II DNA or RNA helicase